MKTLYGNLHTPDWPDDLIVRSLTQLGEWCATEAILASCLLKANETLCDAGAFLGTFSLGLARQTSPGHVIAIEANPVLNTALAQNLQNLPCRATPLSCGLGRAPGWLVPEKEIAANHGAASYVFQDAPPENGAPAIPCKTLAQIREAHGDYDMVKLDIEGMEREVLLGDAEYLRSRMPVIWAECNEDPESLQLLGALKWLKYEVTYVAFPVFRSDNFNGSDDLIYPMAYEAALVAGPANLVEQLAARAGELVPGEDILCRPISTAFDLRRALFDTPRWSRLEWARLTRAELIARLMRCGDGSELSTFMVQSETDCS